MNKKKSNKILCLLFLFLPPVLLPAQQQTTGKVSIDRNRILIGEPIRLSLEAEIPGNEPIRFYLIDSLPHFEILHKPRIDTIDTNGGTTLKQDISITSFDSGHWVIPAFRLGDKVISDTLPVDVVFSDFDPTRDYHDIKDIIEIKPPEEKKSNWIWYLAGGAVLLAGLLIYILMRKKKPLPPPALPVANPYQDALQQLGQLQRGSLDPKQYYSRLVDIFRVYVSKKKGIHSLQKTTDDLVIQMKSLHLHREQFEQLSQALRLSDFVKFAKYTPDAEDDTAAFRAIKKSIDDIEQLSS